MCVCVCVSACGEANSALQIAKQMDLKRFTLNGISQPLPKATKQKQKQQVIRWNGLHVRPADTLYISNTFDRLEIRDLILQQGISMCVIKLSSVRKSNRRMRASTSTDRSFRMFVYAARKYCMFITYNADASLYIYRRMC